MKRINSDNMIMICAAIFAAIVVGIFIHNGQKPREQVIIQPYVSTDQPVQGQPANKIPVVDTGYSRAASDQAARIHYEDAVSAAQSAGLSRSDAEKFVKGVEHTAKYGPGDYYRSQQEKSAKEAGFR